MATNVRKTLLDVFNGSGGAETFKGGEAEGQKSMALSLGAKAPPSPSHASPPKAPRKANAHKKSYSTGSSSSSSGFDIQKLLRGDNVDATNSSGRDREDPASRSSESVKSLDTVTAAGSKEKKKRRSLSWYNVLSPSYKSRTEDFKRLFRDLPDSERLIVDYSCALQKDILVHGRLYISQNFICFYANIFRWETMLTVRCKDVTSISKEKTALVIPNAIQICTASSERHFLTSFGAREKTYMMLFRVWQNALMDQPMTPQELWQWIHLSYGDDLGLTSDDDDYISPSAIGNGDKKQEDDTTKQLESLQQHDHLSATDLPPITPVPPLATTPPVLNSALTMGDGGNTMGGEIPEEEEDGGKECPEKSNEAEEECCSAKKVHARTGSKDGLPVAQAVAPVRTSVGTRTKDEALTDAMSESEKDDVDAGEVTCLCGTHEGREMVNVVLGYSVDRTFDMLFANSKFMREFHASRKTANVVYSPWCTHRDVKTRQVSYALQVNLGLTMKVADTIETQSLVKGSQAGHAYTVSVDAITPGLPYGDAFYTHHSHCLTRVSLDECRLRIHSQIKYKKSVWGVVKSFIERNAWSGLTEFYKEFQVSLVKEVAANEAPVRPVKVRRRLREVEMDLMTTLAPKDRVEEDEEEDGDDADKEFISTQQWRLPTKAIHKDTVRLNSTTTDIMVPVILLVLISLLVLNAMLYYRLWAMDTDDDGRPASGYIAGCSIDPELLKEPKSNEDWLRLLRQQEVLHRTEISKWAEIIDTVVALLHETETSLINLKNNIQAYNRQGPTKPGV